MQNPFNQNVSNQNPYGLPYAGGYSAAVRSSVLAKVSGLLAFSMVFTALGLMAAGAGMQLGALSKGKALSAALLCIRHFVLPLVALVLGRLWGLPELQSTMLLAFAALPTASTAYVLAARMGYDGAYVAGLVTLSTLLGMASLSFALGVLRVLPL